MKREFKVEANVGKPQVAYRETIRTTVEQEGKFVRAVGRPRPVRPRVDHAGAAEPGKGYEFVERHRRRHDPARNTSRPSTRASRKRLRTACSPAIRSSTSRSRCSTARTTTSTRTKWRSRSPASWRSRTACARRKPVILEPIMKVEVVTPEDYMGDMVGDLNSPPRHIPGHGGFRVAARSMTAESRWPRCSGTRPRCAR